MKTRTILRRIITILISLVLCITITDTTSFAKSKAKPTISDTKVTMNTNEEYCISLDRASSKVTWKSSNRKLVKIENGKKSKNVLEKVTQTKQSLMIRYKMCAASYHPKMAPRLPTAMQSK